MELLLHTMKLFFVSLVLHEVKPCGANAIACYTATAPLLCSLDLCTMQQFIF